MFSVIIPVHNSEKAIRRCLDSIAGQTYDDFEALVIENGSTDASLEICREYESGDCRFKVFDIGKCNGPSKPRNYALDIAMGDYIAFVDSDDWIEPDHLEILANKLKETDVVFCGYGVDDEDGGCIKKIIPNVDSNNKIDQCYELIANDSFGYSCCCAFSRKMSESVFFDESINLFEDLVFTTEIVKKAHQLGFTDFATYHYVQGNPNAITKNIHRNMIQKKDIQFNAHFDLLCEKYHDYLIRFANDCVSFCVNYAFENGFNIRSSYNSIRQTKYFVIAKSKPGRWIVSIEKGYLNFLKDYLKYKIRCKAHDIFR